MASELKCSALANGGKSPPCDWNGTSFKAICYRSAYLSTDDTQPPGDKRSNRLQITVRVRPTRVAVPGLQRMHLQAHCQLIKHAHRCYARLPLPANPRCSDNAILICSGLRTTSGWTCKTARIRDRISIIISSNAN